METTFIDSMYDMAKMLGKIEKLNMYNERYIYIEGKTEDGEKFNLSLTIEKEKEEKDA